MKATYKGASDEQVHFGNCVDPRGILMEGQTYEVAKRVEHNWHTKIYLVGWPELGFNSVCFDEIEDDPHA